MKMHCSLAYIPVPNLFTIRSWPAIAPPLYHSVLLPPTAIFLSSMQAPSLSRHSESAVELEFIKKWQELLSNWSEQTIATLNDKRRALLATEVKEDNRGVLRRKWLGCDGADEQQLAALEERLGGVALPPSYRAFLRVSNGWLFPSQFVSRLLSLDQIGWLKDLDEDRVRTWKQAEKWVLHQDKSHDETITSSDDEYFIQGELHRGTHLRPEYLATTLQISEIEEGGSAVYLLNPKVMTEDGEWEAWLWANWRPKAMRFRSFFDLMEEEHKRRL
jgi:hypothetical protein